MNISIMQVFKLTQRLKSVKHTIVINQHLAYIYDVIVQAKQTIEEEFTLKTTYAIKTKAACSGEITLSKAGSSSWREFSSSS